MALSLESCFLYWWRSVGIPQHGFETARKVVGEDARVVLVGGHERGHAQQQQHEGLDGQGRSEHSTQEPVAPGQHPRVDGVAAQAIVSICLDGLC